MRICFNEEDKKNLLNMLLEDKPFSEIKQVLKVNKNYNLKVACEFLGGKYLKAYLFHANNQKNYKKFLPATTQDTTNNEVIYKCFKLLNEQIVNLKETLLNTNTLEEKQLKANNEEIVYFELPKVLPTRLKGSNYQVKHTSVKVILNVWEEFQLFAKANNEYSTIEHLSLAILEYLEKYSGK